MDVKRSLYNLVLYPVRGPGNINLVPVPSTHILHDVVYVSYHSDVSQANRRRFICSSKIGREDPPAVTTVELIITILN